MRRYLLDTTPLAALLNNRPAALAQLRGWLVAHELATSILVYGEVVESLKRYPDFPRRHAALRALLRSVSPYLPGYPVLERYADLRRALRPPHGPGADWRSRYTNRRHRPHPRADARHHRQ